MDQDRLDFAEEAKNIWPVVQPMSEFGEFVFVSRKLTVRVSVTQIGNNTSTSGASIQSRTALNVGEMKILATDQLEAVQQREHRDTRDFLFSGTSSRRRCQNQEGKEARTCCNKTQNKTQSLLLNHNIVQIASLVFYRP